jgi:predicted metal-dependent hydrolase
MLPDTPARLERGRALFNARLFWEAHEAWEEAWMEEDGDARLFLQGLIQVAAGYYKAFVQQQPVGCVKLLGTGLDKLRPLDARFAGIALSAFVARVEQTLASAQAWHAGGAPIDAREVPKLTLSTPDG